MIPPPPSAQIPRENDSKSRIALDGAAGCALQPPSAPEMLTSSPRIVTLDWFRHRFGRNDRRKNLIERMTRQIDHLPSFGAVAQFVLVGGSFVTGCDDPADLDCIVGYRAWQDNALMADIRHWRLFPDIDVRFVPTDVDPMVTIKAFCFFHTLYLSLDKGPSQGSLMIQWKNE